MNNFNLQFFAEEVETAPAAEQNTENQKAPKTYTDAEVDVIA